MNKTSNYFEIIVGTFVLFCAIFFLFSSLRSTQVSDTKGYRLIAKFDNIDGINSGSDVKISGVKLPTKMPVNIVHDHEKEKDQYMKLLDGDGEKENNQDANFKDGF